MLVVAHGVAYEQCGEGVDYEPMPLAVDWFRRLGKEVACALSELGDVAASGGWESKAAFVMTVRQERIRALCQDNARIYCC